MVDQDDVEGRAQKPVCARKYFHLDHFADLLVQIGSTVQFPDYSETVIDQDEVESKAQEPVCARKYCHIDHFSALLA